MRRRHNVEKNLFKSDRTSNPVARTKGKREREDGNPRHSSFTNERLTIVTNRLTTRADIKVRHVVTKPLYNKQATLSSPRS